jgi:acetolactate synthase-1/2/3 large subunit
VKVFLFANDGYASIRMTQRNYFGGAYVGCDARTGLGTPNWDQFFKAYDLEAVRLDSQDPWSETVIDELASPGPSIFIVPIDPEQTYYPKITSRMADSGAMESNPLHRMTPELPPNLRGQVLVFLDDEEVTHE